MCTGRKKWYPAMLQSRTPAAPRGTAQDLVDVDMPCLRRSGARVASGFTDRGTEVKIPRLTLTRGRPRNHCRHPILTIAWCRSTSVSYTHLRAHETPEHLVCRLLL